MTDLTIHHVRICDSCIKWGAYVEGSNGETYRVTYGEIHGGRTQYGWSCSCPAFHYHPARECKHIRQVKPDRCAWNEGAFAGSFSEADPDGSCPKCGDSTTVIRVAV